MRAPLHIHTYTLHPTPCLHRRRFPPNPQQQHTPPACPPAGPSAPQHLLEVAYLATQARGSSTACILCLENERLHASNLGDSGARRAGRLEGGSGRPSLPVCLQVWWLR